MRPLGTVLCLAAAALGVCPLLAAATITYSFSGTIGPVLSGSDPLGLNGQSATLTVTISSTAAPQHTSSTGADYAVPAADAQLMIGGTTATALRPVLVHYTFPAAGPCPMTVAGSFTSTLTGPIDVALIAWLGKGSFTSAVLQHPQMFVPSPQLLTPAKNANGPGSKLEYHSSQGRIVLGFGGVASDNAPPPPPGAPRRY